MANDPDKKSVILPAIKLRQARHISPLKERSRDTSWPKYIWKLNIFKIKWFISYTSIVNVSGKGTGTQLWKPDKHIRWETGKKLKTSRAELPLTTETSAVRRRPEKTCPKKPWREKVRAGNLGRDQGSRSKPFLQDLTMYLRIDRS